jgi:hypothetical protein
VAGEIADGDMAGLVVLDVARSLVELLDLQDCRFERAPFAGAPRPCLIRGGQLQLGDRSWDPAQIGLPASGFHIPLVARGHAEGRYVCMPRGRRRPSRQAVMVAGTLADQAASALLFDTLVG